MSTSNALDRRLCIVTPAHLEAMVGGAQVQIENLLDVLIPMSKFDIHYLARRVPIKPASHYRIVRIGRKSAVPRLGYITDFIPLYRALRRLRPEVIYQRVGCGYTGIAAWYARRNGARMIWHVAHDNDVMRESLRDRGNILRRIAEKRCIEYGIRHAHQIVVQTRQQADLLQKNYGRSADAIIQNFQPQPAGPFDKSREIKVVWVANFKRWKRPEAFIRLAQRLRNLSNVQFIMVGAAAAGAGDREWNDALMKAIAAVPNLSFVGSIGQVEVKELLGRSHVLVNTSQFEGFPNTFIEAWMREVPVVSLSVNPDDVFGQEEIGIHAITEERMAEAVRLFVTNPEIRNRYAVQARQYAIDHHSLSNAYLLAQLIDTGSIAGTPGVKA